MNTTKLKAVLFAAIMVTSVFAGVMGAATAQSDTPDAPGVQTEGTVTIDSHNTTWDSPLHYENDNGEVVALDGHVNASQDNPYRFDVSHVEFGDADEFPHSDADISWYNESRWTVGGSASAKGSVAETTTEGTPALEVATDDSMTSGDTVQVTFDDVDISSDVQKKHLATALNVPALDSGAEVQIRAEEADGDYVRAVINSSASGEDTIANSTGDGRLYQRQMGQMTVYGTGDGTLSNIDSVTVQITDADATVEMTMLNLDKMGTYTYGETREDTDDDDELETTQITERKDAGAVEVHSLDTLGDSIRGSSGATVHGLTMDVIKEVEDVDPDDIEYNLTETDDRPGYHGTATLWIPTGVESAYELGWTGLSTTAEQAYLEDRYLAVEYAEGVGDTNPQDVGSWTDQTGMFSEEGTVHSIDDTIQPGQTNYVRVSLRLQESEFNTLRNTLESLGEDVEGGVGMGPGSGGGGPISFVQGVFGSIVAVVAGLFAKARGWIPGMG
ncbi:hypothetical protein [Haloplanus salilacus]|uniref:hypothetical protein n=1 Tax=Haloplanus salilacus TaxID=2949994 RepID=UPI0030D455D8